MEEGMEDEYTTVVAYLPLPPAGRRGQGLLTDLRGVVAMARRRHPQLAERSIVDIGIRQIGDRIEATVRFDAE